MVVTTRLQPCYNLGNGLIRDGLSKVDCTTSILGHESHTTNMSTAITTTTGHWQYGVHPGPWGDRGRREKGREHSRR